MRLKGKIKWQVIFFLLTYSCLFLTRRSEILAYCNTNATESSCNSSYDCSNNAGMESGIYNQQFCDQQYPPNGSTCFEVVGPPWFTICYYKKNQPTPTPASCGQRGDNCCPAPDLCCKGPPDCDIKLIPQNTGGGGCICVEPNNLLPTSLPNPNGPIYYLTDANCDPGSGNVKDGVNTAIGCIPINNFDQLIGWLLSKLIFVASGVAFLLMVLGAIQI